MVKQFHKLHKQDTSYRSKKEARRLAEQALKTCEGFMLFTVQKDPGSHQLKYAGNAFIQQDHAAGMPQFIMQVLNGRKAQLEGEDGK